MRPKSIAAKQKAASLIATAFLRVRGPSAQEREPVGEALALCAVARNQIPAEHARLKIKLEAAESPSERDAIEYQLWLVDTQLGWIEDIAKWRKSHLATLNDRTWPAELLRCQERSLDWIDPWGKERTTSGLLYWFCRWAWTYDPRGTIKTLPFYPFEVQEQALEKIEAAVEGKVSLLIDKSRDMGVTWLLADWDVYHWRFTRGFAALLGNRTEDEVDDSQGNMDATFNKLRFQIKLLPKAMLPQGFTTRRHMTFMAITNPDNGANLSGRAPVEDFGRGARRTVIQPDEFASWKETKGHKQYQAMSQTSHSLIITSTVKGIFNKYGELLLDSNMPKFIIDWKSHPWKDERWYEALPRGYLGPPMTATDIAQEVDRDPYASQPGQVLSQWNEVRNVITYSEFYRVYGRLPQYRRSVFPPLPWNATVAQDVGTTPEHPNVTVWLTRPGQIDPYPKSIFAVGEMVRVGLSSRQIAEGVRDPATNQVVQNGLMHFEREHALTARIKHRILSHEATTEMLGYLRDCTEYRTAWSKWPGDATGGIEQWANALQIQAGPNPFVIDPRTCDPAQTWKPFVHKHRCSLCETDHIGAHLDGYVEFMLVVPDDEAKLIVMEDGKLARTPAKTEAGFPRGRYEIPGWHYPESEKGKPVKQRKPQKGEDDFCDSCRMAMGSFTLGAVKPSTEELVELELPPEHRREVVAAKQGTPDESIALQGRMQQEALARRRVQQKQQAASGLSVYEKARRYK